ncbi:MAG: ANTAR domain-containing protein [Actinophytocola sp.]|nr:ANTAR domain-containing protein [Actinophytocola sp.]
MVDGCDQGAFLNLLADRCARLLDLPAAALLLVEHGGQARMEGASDDPTRVLARLDEGPGPDCARSGEPVIAPDLTRTSLRWPEFTALALSTGFTSAHALPMRRRSSVIGSLTLFSEDIGELDKATGRVGQAAADLATIGLLQIRALRRQEEIAGQLQHALTSRVVIEQAKGVTGERMGLGMDAAFNALRRYARSNNVRIAELAASVVDGSFDTGLLEP